jgi:hypothetical protein
MAPPTVKHSVKEVDFLGRRVPVVMQAAGGASPLLAVGACPRWGRRRAARAAPLRRCSTALSRGGCARTAATHGGRALLAARGGLAALRRGSRWVRPAAQ